MSTHLSPADLPQPVIARCATAGDRRPLKRLWLIFRHEMSIYTRALPNPDGTYRSERLLLGLSDPSWRAWMLTADDRPIGFTLVRALDQPVHVLTSFFIVAPAPAPRARPTVRSRHDRGPPRHVDGRLPRRQHRRGTVLAEARRRIRLRLDIRTPTGSHQARPATGRVGYLHPQLKP